jgi:hypothetical protein
MQRAKRSDKEFPLVNTGATQAYDNKELNKMFHTKELSFLESQPVDVLGRKFNCIPARRGDPPRSETDMPPIQSLYNCTNVGVKSDFPKSISNWENANMWKDGTYDDAKNSIYREEDASTKKVKFAPDYDFQLRYNRMDAETRVASNIADYFQDRDNERTIENRIFLEEYGLTGGEVDEVMARMKVDGALEAIKDPKRRAISKKKNFERLMADAVAQKVEFQQRYADMDKRDVPIDQFIMESSGGVPREKAGIQRRAVSEAPVRGRPLRDDINPEYDAEPSAFNRGEPMGGAGGPDEGPNMEPRNYRFLKIKKASAEATSETDPVNLRKKPPVADPKKLALFRYDAIAKSEKTYEAIDTIATRIDIENILRHKFNKTVTPNTSKPKLINLLLAELK